MLNCMKVKVDTNQVVMTREELARVTAPVSGPLLPLTVENLPWDGDTRLENEAYVHRYVSNTSTDWYRTRTVVLNRKSVWKLQRFLEDLHTETRYTVDEMEDILGIQRQEYPEDWKSILMKAGLPELLPKLPKPFHMTTEQILSEVKAVTNTLRDIGNRIGDSTVPKKATDSLDLEDITAAGADEESGHRPNEAFRMMYQSHIDLWTKYGLLENSYIQLMKIGEQQENDEVEVKEHKHELLEVWQPEKEVIPVKKTLNYWEKLQKNKIKEKLRKEKVRKEKRKQTATRKFYSKAKHMTTTGGIIKAKYNMAGRNDSYRVKKKNNGADAKLKTAEITKDKDEIDDHIASSYMAELMTNAMDKKLQTAETTEDINDISDYSDSDGSEHKASEGNETTDDVANVDREIDEDMSDSTCTIATCIDTEQGRKKKKRRGFLRRVTAPFRWLKKRVGT